MLVPDHPRTAGSAMADAHRPFLAAAETLPGGTAIISVSGELDIATAPALERTLLGLADERMQRLIVDLTGCSFLACSGIGVLLATRARLAGSRRPLALVASRPGALRTLELTEVDDVFDVHPSRRAALEAGGNGHA